MTNASDADAFLVPQPDTIPGPYPSAESAPYWDGARRHELWFQRCGVCGSAVFDPAIVCRRCGASDLTWEQSAGLGSVYSWTVVWRPPQPAFVVPYAPAIITLDEGYQMLASIVGCRVGDLAVGRRVAVEFHPVAGGHALPCFRHV
ncbi:MAG: Zn-ribbon domain-containing OB-fold protein [Actinomycetota bacterium]